MEIDTWVAGSGKNSLRRDWIVRDYKTGYILAQATRYAWTIVIHESISYMFNPPWPSRLGNHKGKWNLFFIIIFPLVPEKNIYTFNSFHGTCLSRVCNFINWMQKHSTHLLNKNLVKAITVSLLRVLNSLKQSSEYHFKILLLCLLTFRSFFFGQHLGYDEQKHQKTV